MRQCLCGTHLAKPWLVVKSFEYQEVQNSLQVINSYGIVLGDLTICSMLRIASFSCTILLPALPALLIPSSQPGQKSQNTQNLFVAVQPIVHCWSGVQEIECPRSETQACTKTENTHFWSSSRILKSSKFVDVGFEYITSSDRWKMEGL